MEAVAAVVVLLVLLAVPAYLLGAWDVIASFLHKPDPPLPPAIAARLGRPSGDAETFVDYSGSAERRSFPSGKPPDTA